MKPRVAVYCRVVTADQLGIESQKVAALKKGRELYPHAEFKVYGDIGGASGRNRLPSFERFLADECRQPYSAVLVHSPSRISRSCEEVVRFEKLMEKHGTALHYAEGQNILTHLRGLFGKAVK